MPSRPRRATLAGVDRLRPGDHAFAAFAHDRERWDALGAFTRHGLARGEKVMLSVDTDRPLDEVAADLAGTADRAREAVGRGQLVVFNARPSGPGSFDVAELAGQARQHLDAAAAKGFSGIRVGCELSPARVPAGGVSTLADWDRSVHREILAADTDARFTALCHLDERRFGDGAALEEVRSLHPVIVLPAPGAVRVTRTGTGIRLTGDADLASREEFTSALRALEDMRMPSRRPLVLDLARLSFLDAHSAGAMLRLAAGLSPPRRLEIRCREHHRRMLNVLGARSVRQLTIVTSHPDQA